MTDALKREVGSSIYIGWASSVLLLLGGAVICFVCCEKERPPPSYYYMPYSTSPQYSSSSAPSVTLRSDVMRSNSWRMFDQSPNRTQEHVALVHHYNPPNKAQSESRLYNQPLGTQAGSERGMLGPNPSNRSGTPDKGRGSFMGMKPNLMRDIPSRASTTVPSEYYYDRL